MKHFLNLVFAAAIALIAPAAHADVLATYDLNSALNSSMPVGSAAPGFTVSPFTATGVSGAAFSNHFYFSNWGTSVNSSKYLSMSINHAGAYNLSQMTFAVETTGSTLASVFVRSSLDGFASDIDFFNWTSSTGDVTNGDFDLSSLGSLSGLTELRFYFATTNTNIQSGFANHEVPGAGAGLPDVGRDITINGTVPEPSALALFAMAGLGMLVTRRRTRV